MIKTIMKKKNILFILFIIIGIPFLCFILLIAGGLWLYFSKVKTADEQPRKVENSQPYTVRHTEQQGYNIQNISYADFTDHLSLDKNTSMHVSYFWEKANGMRVTWTGKVVDVKGGRGKAEITVVNQAKPAVDGYNIMLVSYKPDQAAALKKGDTITFSGDLYNFRRRAGHSIIVYLKNVEILH